LKRNDTCTGGAVPKPPVFDLPCNITCGEGEYLPLGELVCSPCTPGTFTRGGALTVKEWTTWDTSFGFFSTQCVNNLLPSRPLANCSGWVLSGATVRSGAITDGQSSILVFQTQLIRAGAIKFLYRVDAEPQWDGLIFYIDGNIVLPKVSVNYVFTKFVANVSAGYHTFTWEYYKDRSVSKGEDAAFIESLEIVGFTYAESSCTPCDVGTFAPNSSSIECTSCPLNTYAIEKGSASCTPCPAGYYSYTGMNGCLGKVPCTADDYQILYGSCTSGNNRTATASWLEPHFCDDANFSLPEDTTVPCEPCPPGTFQDASFACVPCATGTYSAGGGAACQSCGAGNFAPKVFNFSTFDSWPAGVSTFCTGSCGTDGWRLRSDYIDSGSGHGETADSSINIQLTLEQPGLVTFTFALYCNRFCALFYLDYPYDASIQWNKTSVKGNNLVNYTTPVALQAGPHNLTWTFELQPYDGTPNTYLDSVRIYSIIVSGTDVGGAATCSPCQIGSVAANESSFCTNCSSGFSNDPTLSQCVSCAGNTFSPQEGDICYECGATTTANVNHTDCVDNCTFVLNGDTYDLSPLASHVPFGPIYDGLEYYYYINLCGRGNFVAACHDDSDVPLETHVCQVLPFNYSLDVGWSTGYYPIPPSQGEKGFVVHYDLGVAGCGPKNHGVAYPRSTNLTMICDLTAGLGTIQIPHDSPVEVAPCQYSFIWRSLYACPICATSDYAFYYTLCGANGMRNKIYYWKDPILCHDGVPLPASEEVGCSDSTVFCGIGEQLSEDGTTCVSCPQGEYSVGGGLLIRSWPINSALPYGYYSSCTGACTNWASDDGISIHSGFGDSSLYASHSFMTNGTISFDYKVFSPTDGALTFYVDGLPQFVVQGVSLYEWNHYSLSITPGSHIFRWRFTEGIRYSPTLLTYQSVSIYNIFIEGLDYHADSCLPCPDGTNSSSDPSGLGCSPCPANTYNAPQTSQCVPCSPTQFSFPGSTSCLNKTACTNSSYVPLYTPCLNGTRNVTYIPLLPGICTGGVPQPHPRTGIPCAACPPYTITRGDDCFSCVSPQYYNFGACQENTPGYIVQYGQNYFTDDTTENWPEPFYTGCSGACGTDGWRLAGAYIDSGFHASNVVDSYVGVIANFIFNGQVVFTYSLNTSEPLDGFQFAIDSIVIPIEVPQNESHPVTVFVPVPAGMHTLVWNYHQEAATGWARLSDIMLLGVDQGVAAASVPCEAGLYASDPAAANCTLCAPGTYSPVAGSSKCISCPVNTYNPGEGAHECRACDYGSYSNATGSTQCSTTCVFEIGNDAYDLTGLPALVTVYDHQRRQYQISVCGIVGDQCPSSHSCIVAVDNSVTEAGNSFRFIPDPDNSTVTPFSIAFEHGDMCPGTNVARSTVIHFECEAESTTSIPDYEDETNCTTTFTWRSFSACRKCIDSDYTTITGACSNGHRAVSKMRMAPCNGAVSTFIKNEKCSGQEFPLAAIIVIVLVFVAIVAVAGFIFFRNRKLAQRYAALMEESRATNVSM